MKYKSFIQTYTLITLLLSGIFINPLFQMSCFAEKKVLTGKFQLPEEDQGTKGASEPVETTGVQGIGEGTILTDQNKQLLEQIENQKKDLFDDTTRSEELEQ